MIVFFIILIFTSNIFSYNETAVIDTSHADSLNMTRRSSLNKLIWSAKELEAIQDIYSGKVFYGRDATEKKFKQLAADANIIHLATHGLIDDKNALYSKLAFYKSSDSTEDGFLNTYEIYNLDLRAQLVVLSACNTGYGKLINGEGLMSLARGFIYAGSSSIVMSLWAIDDGATYHLMKNFYSNLAKGMPKDKALRDAKLTYIKNSDPLKANPYFWAGLVPVGSTAPIETSHKNIIIFWLIAAVIILLLFFIIKRKFISKSHSQGMMQL